MDDALARPGGDYHVFVADTSGEVQGYVCFGATPLTEGTWDLYWIAVDPQSQGSGIGRALMALAEGRVATAGGRLLLVETSGSDLYGPTRVFYEALRYREVSRIEDFYRPGDAKVTYAKRLP
ncbi:MAG: N-acetyltransferase [Dehalococcoidia bacterium]|nr:N-acetyltransferase [Dehalococcoidia bacterium]